MQKPNKDSLGDRMKLFEHAFRTSLPIRMPVIIRLDGKNFSNYTKKLNKPFDENLISTMSHTAYMLCKEIQGAELAYIQSDEISILVHYYKRFNSEPWFDNEVQKIVSVSAGMASAIFSEHARNFPKFQENCPSTAVFDSRVFVLPESEVCNALIWRQQDCVRNSIQMLARSLYSHKECHNKNCSDLQEMCFQKGHNWNDLSTYKKRGYCVKKKKYTESGIERAEWIRDFDIPTFTQNRGYIEEHLVVKPEEEG